jgi:hypothetical protein
LIRPEIPIEIIDDLFLFFYGVIKAIIINYKVDQQFQCTLPEITPPSRPKQFCSRRPRNTVKFDADFSADLTQETSVCTIIC